jgi:hypothetical protein
LTFIIDNIQIGNSNAVEQYEKFCQIFNLIEDWKNEESDEGFEKLSGKLRSVMKLKNFQKKKLTSGRAD